MEKVMIGVRTKKEYADILTELAEKEQMTLSKFVHKMIKANLRRIGKA